MEVTHVLGCHNTIGEGPVWRPQEKALYWVDIAGKTINAYTPGTGSHEVFPSGSEVGVFAFREHGGLVIAGSGGFAFWDKESGPSESFCDPESDRPDSRFNDGKVDRAGRFWAGTLTLTGAVSSLYRLDADLTCHAMESGITISNGTGWSPDNRTMYFVDSLRYVIYAYDFDLNAGEIDNRRNFFVVDESYGIPDGLTVDSEGCIWCAFYAGSRVTRIDPDGTIMTEVSMPVTKPTSCIFGGDDMKDLYVTSAADGLSEDELKQQPNAGDLFVIHTDVRGIPETDFAG